jgi:hypothetical protein
MRMSSDKRVKVQFFVDPDDQRGVKTENLWAEEVAPGRFRILNNPFFLFGVSADDIVEAKQAGDGLRFQKVVSRGGHSTYRLFLRGARTINEPSFRTYWQPISNLGATFENADNYFVSVDIPPGKDVAAIYELMEKGEKDGIWTFEEVHYAG